MTIGHSYEGIVSIKIPSLQLCLGMCQLTETNQDKELGSSEPLLLDQRTKLSSQHPHQLLIVSHSASFGDPTLSSGLCGLSHTHV